MDKERKKEEKRETPIVDGDARPDMPVDPERDDKSSNRKKFESERVSDVNSLEDYKDAKKE